MPVIQVMLGQLGLVSSEMMFSQWRYVVVGATVAAAVLTPSTDPFTQTLLAVPLVGLYMGGAAAVSRSAERCCCRCLVLLVVLLVLRCGGPARHLPTSPAPSPPDILCPCAGAAAGAEEAHGRRMSRLAEPPAIMRTLLLLPTDPIGSPPVPHTL